MVSKNRKTGAITNIDLVLPRFYGDPGHAFDTS